MKIANIIMPKLYLDCDGVLADFQKLARRLLRMDPDEFEAKYGSKAFWKILHDFEDENGYGFFRALDLMPGAQKLWNSVKHLNPPILTGCPGGTWSQPQKTAWALDKFQTTNIITCNAKEKIRHIENPGDILVDDKTKHKHIWEEGGGIFVHHTSVDETLKTLKALQPIWFQRTDQWTPAKV